MSDECNECGRSDAPLTIKQERLAAAERVNEELCELNETMTSILSEIVRGANLLSTYLNRQEKPAVYETEETVDIGLPARVNARKYRESKSKR